LDAAVESGGNPSYVFEKIDKIIKMLNGVEASSAYLHSRSSGG
jgi:hypothetical protein